MWGIVGTGAMHSNVHGDVAINVTNGHVEAIFGAAEGATVDGNVNINVSGGTIGWIHGGGSKNPVTQTGGIIEGSTNIVISGNAAVTNHVFGGGWGGSAKYSSYVDTIKGGTNITLKDNATVGGIISGNAGELSYELDGISTIEGIKAFNVENYTGGSDLNVKEFNAIKVTSSTANFTSAFNVDTLSVDTLSAVSLTAGTDFSKLTVIEFKDLSEGQTDSLSLNSIFGDSASIVVSALQDSAEFTLMGNNGEWAVDIDGFNGDTINFTVSHQIPEPSTYAAIFGAMALAFATYRRRK